MDNPDIEFRKTPRRFHILAGDGGFGTDALIVNEDGMVSIDWAAVERIAAMEPTISNAAWPVCVALLAVKRHRYTEYSSLTP
jgi:hypothetical protein